MHMEMSQANILCSYLKQTKQECRTGPARGLGVRTSESVEEMGIECGKVNIVQILCSKYVTGKMRPTETIPRMGERG
jgi:hypothetical protein